MYIYRRSGADNLLSLRSFATSFKKCLWSLILYNFFHDFIHVYSPGAGGDNPLGTKFWCQQEYLVTLVICSKFQKKVFEVWFYTIFSSWFYIFYLYSPGAGADSPQGKKWCQQKCLVTSFSCYIFQNMSLKSDFIKKKKKDLIMYIVSGQGQTAPGDKIFMLTERPYT